MSLPTPPLRRDGPELFADRGDAFMEALPVFEARMEAIDANVIAREAVAVASAAAAASSAAEAANIRVAAKWLAATNYAVGVTAWSPADQRVYRRKVAGVTATDPSADGANWSLVDGTMPVALVATAAHTAVAGAHYVVTTGSATTITLPASPLSGDSVSVTFANSLTTNVIARGGSTVMGLAEDMQIDSARVTVHLRYMNSDWKIV